MGESRHGFVYVSFADDPWEVWRSVRLSGGIRVPILFDGRNLRGLQEWGVTGVPWVFVIDSRGRVLERSIGEESDWALLRRVEADPDDRRYSSAVAP
jgi:hypothetical protein